MDIVPMNLRKMPLIYRGHGSISKWAVVATERRTMAQPSLLLTITTHPLSREPFDCCVVSPVVIVRRVLSSPTAYSFILFHRMHFLLPPPSIAPHCGRRCYRPSPVACCCRHLSSPSLVQCLIVVSSLLSPSSFVIVRRHPTSIIRCCARLPSSSPHPLSSASTARFRCSQRDDIAVAVISATSSSLPNDNGQRRDRNGRRRRNGRRDGGNGSPLSLTATTSTPPCVTRPPPTSHLC